MQKDISKITVSPDTSIKKAIAALHNGHQRVLFIADSALKLLGVVSDSDIRNAILTGLNLELPISQIMQTKPVVADASMGKDQVIQLMRDTKRYEVPVLDNGTIVGLQTLNALMEAPHPERIAVIMAGGLGSRLLPVTIETPKPLIPVSGKPILFWILDRLLAAHFNKIYISIRYKGELIKQAIDAEKNYRGRVEFLEEDAPLGTAGALALLPKSIDSPILVMNADLLTQLDFVQLLQFHEKESNDLTVAVKEEIQHIQFGVVELEGNTVVGIEEKPIRSFFVNAGIYAIQPDIIRTIKSGTPVTMTEVIQESLRKKKKIGSFPIYESWIDIGNHENLKAATQLMSEED